MSRNDVNIAEAAFERTRRMDRRCAGRIEDQINCFDRTLHAVDRREPERRTLLDRDFSARCNDLPDVVDYSFHEAVRRTHASLGASQVALHKRPFTQEIRLMGSALRSCQFGETLERA